MTYVNYGPDHDDDPLYYHEVFDEQAETYHFVNVEIYGKPGTEIRVTPLPKEIDDIGQLVRNLPLMPAERAEEFIQDLEEWYYVRGDPLISATIPSTGVLMFRDAITGDKRVSVRAKMEGYQPFQWVGFITLNGLNLTVINQPF